MSTLRIAAAAAALVVSADAAPAMAHHSGAMFDRSKEVVLKGAIKEFGWNNPHSWIRILVPETGQAMPVEWTIEMGAPGGLARGGWTKSTLKPGDNVELHIYPLKSGAPGGSFKEVTTADGHVLRGGPAGAG